MKQLFKSPIVPVLLLALSAGPVLALDGGGIFTSSKNKKTATAAPKEVKKVSKYEKMFVEDKSCKSAKGPFLTLHNAQGKLYVELPKKYIGREMLIASTISEASDADLSTIGYKPKDPMFVKFRQMDSTIYLTMANVSPLHDKSAPGISKAVKLTGLDPILSAQKIVCYTPDSSAVVIEMTKLFTTDVQQLSPMEGSSGMISITGKFNPDGSALADIKSFEDNVTIKSYMSYSVTASLLGLILLKKDDPMTVKVTRTILLLPEEPMQPRLADARVGTFLTSLSEVSDKKDMIEEFSVVNRWNLQPSDMEAYKRGELVEPARPIVFYVDDAFPALWQKAIHEGVLRWNKAFEKIGFKNAVHVQDFPKDDPNFDPDNLKYSCIRYVPAAVANAMGPSWVDPRSGEIVNASVLVYNDVIKLINRWRFVQTSQVDESVRGKKMPDDIVHESLAYVVAHEVGHCLGFMHNMAASSTYPVDSLRSASFTQKYGTTPSIMDYARFNYVAQPGDKGVKLTPPDLGIYDDYIVKYAYKPVTDKEGMFGEAATIRGWVDEKAGDPRFRYGRQQVVARYDPSAIEEDLGDDPIKAADYGIKNIKYILAHLDEWIPDSEDPDYSHRIALYENLAGQYARYTNAVMLNIGGIYLKEVNSGTDGGPKAIAVPKEIQKASLKWLIDQMKTCDWLTEQSVVAKFPLHVETSFILRYNFCRALNSAYKNVMLSSHISSNPYTPTEFMNDMYSQIWESAIKGRPATASERLVQRMFVESSTDIVSKRSQLIKMGLTSPDDAYAPSVDQIRLFGLDPTGMVEKYIGPLRELEEKEGRGYVACHMLKAEEKLAYGYGWQYNVNLRSIDESRSLFFEANQRILKLLRSRVASATGDTKAHYNTMIYLIEDTTK